MHKFAITALSVLAGMAFVQCAAAADSDVYDRGAKGDLAAFGGAPASRVIWLPLTLSRLSSPLRSTQRT